MPKKKAKRKYTKRSPVWKKKNGVGGGRRSVHPKDGPLPLVKVAKKTLETLLNLQPFEDVKGFEVHEMVFPLLKAVTKMEERV